MLEQEKQQMKENYEKQMCKLEEKMNERDIEYTAQYSQLQSEKLKLEIEIDNIEIEQSQRHQDPQEVHKMGDNQVAHYHTMKKDMQKLIEFKNELESLVEQQNTEINRKAQELAIIQRDLKSRDKQILHMSEYISELEKQLKNEEIKIRQNQVKFKKLKQDKVVEMNKKLRDQQNQIEILKQMVSSSKKEMKSKVHNINKMKQRLNSLEKINKIHISGHSDMHSIQSKNYHEKKNSINSFLNQYNDEEKYSSFENPKNYNGKDSSGRIDEAREDLEQTGRHNQEQTAHFGKTLERKKNINFNSSPENGNIVLNSKTPSMKLMRDISPAKVWM
jgi:DNA repair exonuclease SbcCD ATPase subunit